jgi:1-pyrroline-5-carboxylate dehydrogenase
MGNVVVWNQDSQVFSAQIIIEVFKEAGVPDGVNNVVLETLNGNWYSFLVVISQDYILQDRLNVLKTFGQKLNQHSPHKTYPRIVGETEGKRFYHPL